MDVRIACSFLSLLSLVYLANVAHGGYIKVSDGRLVHGTQRVFLSGANTAWVIIGKDFGDHQYPVRRPVYQEILRNVSKAGGNSMRTWVHVLGQTSPRFNASGYVTGLDDAGTFLQEFNTYLDDALAQNLLIFPCIWNGAVADTKHKLDGLIRDESKLQSYIDNALIPWVTSVKDHPALGGWDIMNEFEGVVITNLTDSDPCFDTHYLSTQHVSWAGSLYTPRQLLKFINWQADAIRRTDPAAMVTAGSWAQGTQSDQFGDHNLYKDECLVKAGGKPNGVLTFYTTHAYVHPFETHWTQDSVFKHSRSEYKLDKPLMVAEFSPKMSGGMSGPEMFTYVYNHSYDGAWSWCMEYTWSIEDQLRGIASLAGSDGVKINLTNPEA